MDRTLIKRITPHLVAIIMFLGLSFAYFSPVLEGKKLEQPDIIQFRGMAREIVEFREETGSEPLWTNSMFGGMPAYQISVLYPSNLIRFADKAISLGLPVPAKYLFLSLIGFYILLLAFRVNPWLAIAGAIAFGFSTYFFIIDAAGHNTKAHAMCYMPPLLAGIYISFRGKILIGCVLTGLFLALQLYTNHLQITYYTLLIVIVFGIVELIKSFRETTLFNYFRTLGLLFIPVILAVGVNFTNLYLTWEYGRYSMRGPSELTHDQDTQTSGLDKDYILDDYSYGIAETMNLFIPDFMGRASSMDIGEGSHVYRELSSAGVQNPRDIVSQMPVYWGGQRFTAGPVYIGAVAIFFFVLGLFVIKGSIKWWLLSATLLSILLAWGKNFMFLSELFIDYFPGYDRFRTVSMILVIAQLTIPLLGVLGISRIINSKNSWQFYRKDVYRTFYILGGISFFFVVFAGIFNYSAPIDRQLISSGWPDYIIDALKQDRLSLLRSDAFRTFLFVLFSAALVWGFLKGFIKTNWLITGVALLFLFDMWTVNRRFLNNDNFVTEVEVAQYFRKSQADMAILQDEDPHFRVFNTTRSPFNDAVTSYHHKSVGGYHGAKLGRYQDLIDFHLSRNNMDVFNMLNTKYFIVPDPERGDPRAQRNPDALGNAWFVEDYRIVQNADQEIEALNDFDPAKEAVVDIRFAEYLEKLPDEPTSEGSIELTEYKPNYLKYRSVAEGVNLAVFSEIHYEKGWEAFINGEKVPHFRVNYVLRGMIVPEGAYEIEFRFDPAGYRIGERISLASSIIMILLIGTIIYRKLKPYMGNWMANKVNSDK